MDWISGYRLPGSLPPDLDGGLSGATAAAGSVSPPLAPCSTPGSNSSSGGLMNMWSNIKQEAVAANTNNSCHSPNNNTLLGLGGGANGGGGGHTISAPGSIKGRVLPGFFREVLLILLLPLVMKVLLRLFYNFIQKKFTVKFIFIVDSKALLLLIML
jgi:hypothetical protein